jgi:hypothetical protein
MSIAAKRALARERNRKKDPNEPSLWRVLFGKKNKAQAPIQPEQTKKGKTKGRDASSRDPKNKAPVQAIVERNDYFMSGALPVGAKISRSDSSTSLLVRTKGKSSKYLPISLNQLIGPDTPPSKLLSRSESAKILPAGRPKQRPQVERFVSSDRPLKLPKAFSPNDTIITYNIGFVLKFNPKALMDYLIRLNCWKAEQHSVQLLVGAIQLTDLSHVVLKKPVTIYAYDCQDNETRNLISGRAARELALETSVTTLDMVKCNKEALQVKFPGPRQLRWMPCRTLLLLRDPLKEYTAW